MLNDGLLEQLHIVATEVSWIDIVASIGVTFIITQSYLFKYIREYFIKHNRYLGKLFSCTMCMGFWSLLIVLLFKYSFPIINYMFITSLCSYILYLSIISIIKKYD